MEKVGWFALERRVDHLIRVGRAWQLCLSCAGSELVSVTGLYRTHTNC